MTFMGILELIRLKELVAIQRDVFGDIEVQRNKDNVIPVEADAPTTGPEAAAAFSSSGDEIALPEAPSEETSADEESLPKEASSEERNSSEPFSQN